MKALNVQEMEQIEGGNKCAVGVALGAATLALGTAGLVMSGGTLGAAAVYLGSRVVAAGSIANACR